MKKQATYLIWILLLAAALAARPARANGAEQSDNLTQQSVSTQTDQPEANQQPAQNTPQTACTAWTQVSLNGFGMGQGSDGGFSGSTYRGYASEEGFEVTVFNNQLYLGVEADNAFGARLWRTKAGILAPQGQQDWEEVVADTNGYPFGLPNPAQADHIDSLESFNGYLYASIANRTGSVLGTRIFRSPTGNPGSWSDALGTQISARGANISDLGNQNFKDMQVFQGHLCGGSSNAAQGAQVWCTSDGTTWEQKNTSGFGRTSNIAIWSGYVYSSTLFFGVQDTGPTGDANDDVARLFSTQNINGAVTWRPVFTGTNGSGRVDILGEFLGSLYISHKSPQGVIILRSPSGLPNTWVQVNQPGMTAGHSANVTPIVDGALVFENELYILVMNSVSGAELWKTANGTDWVEAAPNGMGDSNNIVAELAVFNGALYAWTSNYLTGQQVLRLDCGVQPLQTSKVITVNNTPGGCNSLADAIRAANTGSSVNGCTGSRNDDVIVLAKPITLSGPLPAVSSTIHLEGGGYTLTSAGGAPFNLFEVAANGYLQVSGLGVDGFSGTSGSVLTNWGYAELNRSLFTHNTSSGSGGVVNNMGNLRINQSIFSANQADRGGAIANTGEINIMSTTIVSNTAATGGGGIDNTASLNGAVHMKTTLLAHNTAPAGPECSGSLLSQDFNLVLSLSGCTLTGLTDQTIIGQDPLITPLALNNGAPFLLNNHALLPGSPAVDAAPDQICAIRDFRGSARSVDYPLFGAANQCDIGAFELQNPETSQAVINQSTINFNNTLITITDHAAPTGSHPGQTVVRRSGLPPVSVPGSSAVLPFTVQVAPTNNTNLDIDLTICYTNWEVTTATSMLAPDPVLLLDPTEINAPVEERNLRLFNLNPVTLMWDLVGMDSHTIGCVTKTHISSSTTWAVAAVSPNPVKLADFRVRLGFDFLSQIFKLIWHGSR